MVELDARHCHLSFGSCVYGMIYAYHVSRGQPGQADSPIFSGLACDEEVEL